MQTSPCFVLAAASALAGSVCVADDLRVHRYEVVVNPALTQLSIDACFDGSMPRVLTAGSESATDYLDDLQVVGSSEAEIRQRRSEVYISSLSDSACLHYRVVMKTPADDDRSHRFASSFRRVGGDVTAPPSLWLWRPEELAHDTDIEIVFRLPAGTAVSAPWRLISRDRATATYRVGHAPMRWSALAAFGRFKVQSLSVPGGNIRLAVLDAKPVADVEATRKWLRHAAGAVSSVSGRFPVPGAQMLVVPVAAGANPVFSPFGNEENVEPFPFAMITRGGQPAGIFFIDQRLPLNIFVNDWVAVHELSHLLHPFLGNSGAWLSEGLASYYQQVLRGRTGVLSEHDAWLALHKGFLRGVDGRSGLTLTAASRKRRDRNTYMQIYWSGAAIALLADTELRQRSGGKLSLDVALSRFQDCCLPAERRWQARTFMARLDELVAEDVFSELYEEYANSVEFPDFGRVYRELGIIDDGDDIRLVEAPLAEIRRRIMAPGLAAGSREQ